MKLDEKEPKTCGNCHYGDYYKRRCGMLKTHILCEVYSDRHEKGQKGCHNWKEKKNEVRT